MITTHSEQIWWGQPEKGTKNGVSNWELKNDCFFQLFFAYCITLLFLLFWKNLYTHEQNQFSCRTTYLTTDLRMKEFIVSTLTLYFVTSRLVSCWRCEYSEYLGEARAISLESSDMEDWKSLQEHFDIYPQEHRIKLKEYFLLLPYISVRTELDFVDFVQSACRRKKRFHAQLEYAANVFPLYAQNRLFAASYFAPVSILKERNRCTLTCHFSVRLCSGI